MGSSSKWMALGSLALALSAAACGSAQQSDAGGQTALTEEAASDAHMGLLHHALESVTLRPDQKLSIEQLARDATGRRESVQKARIALRSTVADQVQAGKVDPAALKPQVDALLSAIDQVRPADRVAIGRLHDLLDPAQRNQFVDAVTKSVAGMKHGPHDGAQGMHKWADDLQLTDAQRSQIRSALHDKFSGDRTAQREQWKATREQGRQALEAFRQDRYTPGETAPALFGRDRIEQGIDRMLDLAAVAVPLLTPEQRTLAAQKIRTGAGRF